MRQVTNTNRQISSLDLNCSENTGHGLLYTYGLTKDQLYSVPQRPLCEQLQTGTDYEIHHGVWDPNSCYIEPCFCHLNHKGNTVHCSQVEKKLIFLLFAISADTKIQVSTLLVFCGLGFVGPKVPLPSWYHQRHHHPEQQHKNMSTATWMVLCTGNYLASNADDSILHFRRYGWKSVHTYIISGPMTST